MNKEKFNIQVKVSKSFSYLEYHTDSIMRATTQKKTLTPFSLIKQIFVENTSDKDFEDVYLYISFSHPFFECRPIHLSTVKGKTGFFFEEEIPLTIDGQGLYFLKESIPLTITFKLEDEKTKETLATLSKTISLFPLSQPPENSSMFPLMMAKYVTKDAKALDGILEKAKIIHDDKPFVAYLNNDINAIFEEVHCLFLALKNENLTYKDPSSLADLYKKVQLPHQTLANRTGSSLDFSLLLTALIEKIGLHPLLIFTDGKALVGVLLRETDYFDFVEKSVSNVYNKTSKSIQSIMLLDTAGLDTTSQLSFNKSMEMGNQDLCGYRGGRFDALDIHTCHSSYIKPIPLSNANGEIDFAITPLSLVDEKFARIEKEGFNNIEREEEKDRFTTWERKLLDLSLDNKLVNFTFNKDMSNAVRLVFHSGKELYDFLKGHDSDDHLSLSLFDPHFDNTQDPVNQSTLDMAMKLLERRTLLGLSNEKIVKKLTRASVTALEETGASTLYLCLGMLTWEKMANAPFLLLPITLTKNRLGSEYALSFDFEDIMINETFFEFYKAQTGNDFSDFYGINSDDDYNDIVATFKSKNIGDVSLDENMAFISNFTFAHYVMWSDIHNRKDALKKNPFIKSLLMNESAISNGYSTDGQSMDNLDHNSDFAAPLSYDSTQLKAILQCGAGNSFILDGPPGTGKSQTIVNMIVNAFYQGKSVLFVAEKMAALSVVKNRLDKLGLGRFALELYSQKANKASVFSQLGQSMELGRVRKSDDFERTCQEIELQKTKLNRELQFLHEKEGKVYSLYEAIEREEVTKDYEGVFVMDEALFEKYDEKMDAVIRKDLETIRVEASGIKNYNTSGFKRFQLLDFNYMEREKLLENFTTLKENLNSVNSSLLDLTKALAFSPDMSKENLLCFTKALGIILEKKVLADGIKNPLFFENYAKNMELLENLCTLDQIRKTNQNRLNCDNFKEIKVDDLIALNNQEASFFAKIGNNGKIQKALKPILRPNIKIGNKEIDDTLKLIKDYVTLEKKIEVNRMVIDSFFGEDVLNFIDKAQEYKEVYQNTYELYTALTKLKISGKNFVEVLALFADLAKQNTDVIKIAFNVYRRALNAFFDTEKSIKASYPYDSSDLGKRDFYSEYLLFLNEITDRRNVDEMLSVVKINKVGKQLEELGFGALFALIKTNGFDFDELTPIFDNALSKATINWGFKNNAVNYFSSSDHEELLKEYKAKLEKYSQLVIEDTANRVTSRFINNTIEYKDSTPVGALKKLISKSGRGTTIRAALEKYQDYFRSYFPCFMMSPLSAAQYLSVDSQKFDIVIFDEASQIPTCEAIGPIARGNALIVSGDPKQMPPTDFFKMDISQDKENMEEIEDAESLLDDCLSIEMPRLRLSYHYRSRHESLIDFSNHNFYRDELFTFPSVDNQKSRIEFRLVDPKEKKKSSDLSSEEVQAILDTIRDLLLEDRNRGKSIGVIVFNMRQQEKLKDAIEDYLDANKALKDVSEIPEDKIFVKSLENVQGDERDIIIISVGFKKNQEGKAHIQGPLTLEKGERRLNVAVTRSRERMIVVSTIRGSDIDDSTSTNKGPTCLKNFLTYCENATRISQAAAEKKNAAHDDLISLLQQELLAKGYPSDRDVGESDFKVDLAIRDPNKPRYLLGILLDNKPLNPNISCRDRHFVQKNMLLSLGWKVLDVYTLDYYRFHDKTIDRILDAVKSDSPINEPVHLLKPEFVYDNENFDYRLTPYVKYQFIKKADNYANMGRNLLDPRLAVVIEELIIAEHPISYSLITERLKPYFNIPKYTSKTYDIIKKHLAYLEENGRIFTTIDYDNALFYWPSGNREKIISHFRTGERGLSDYSKEELIFLMNKILEAQRRMNKEDLIRATASMLSLSIVNESVRNKLTFAIDYAIGTHTLRSGLVGN